MVPALKTFFSGRPFWEPEGKSDSIKYKDNKAFKTTAIYYKSQWLLIRSLFFFLNQIGSRSWMEVELTDEHLPLPAVCGTHHVSASAKAKAHIERSTLTAFLQHLAENRTSALKATSTHVTLPPEKHLPVWAWRKRKWAGNSPWLLRRQWEPREAFGPSAA